MAYHRNRQDSEHAIETLAQLYPACFFVEPKLRRPLKHGIIADLQRAGCPFALELITAAVEWYQSSSGYVFELRAGAKRIDLNGKPDGTVTPHEQAQAQKRFHETRDKNSATNTLIALHGAGRIPDDQLKKLDAPPKPTIPPPTTATIAPELAGVHEALATANATLNSCNDNQDMRAAVAAAVLGVVVKAAQHAIARLGAAEQ